MKSKNAKPKKLSRKVAALKRKALPKHPHRKVKRLRQDCGKAMRIDNLLASIKFSSEEIEQLIASDRARNRGRFTADT